MKKVLVLLGPTATGKTVLALYLAKKFNGELVACDSRQVYKGLDIGTGKLPDNNVEVKKYNKRWKINSINIWMYDLVSVKRKYDVSKFVKEARKVIDNITSKGKLPIIVGGTGFYLDVLIGGLDYLCLPSDQNIRKKMEKKNIKQLQDILKNLSLSRWRKLNQSDKNNPRRLIRVIEILQSKRGQNKDKAFEGISKNFKILKIGLTAPRKKLFELSDQRVLNWVDKGIIKEAEALLSKGASFKRIKELGLEYTVIADYLLKKINQEDLITMMQNRIHDYIRRQQTWFKKERDVVWFDITDQRYREKMQKLIFKWYHSTT